MVQALEVAQEDLVEVYSMLYGSTSVTLMVRRPHRVPVDVSEFWQHKRVLSDRKFIQLAFELKALAPLSMFDRRRKS